MKIDNVVLNNARWTHHGTELEIGFRQSESDGAEDDWTLNSTKITVASAEITKFEAEMIKKYTSEIDAAIRQGVAANQWNFGYSDDERLLQQLQSR